MIKYIIGCGSVLLAIILIVFIFHKQINFFIVGLSGVKRVQKKIYKACKENDYLLLNDIWLPVEENKYKHFDTILFANKFIYVISIVKEIGEVSASLNDTKWRVVYEKKLSNIDNPLINNRRAINYIVNMMGNIKYQDLKSIIVLTKTCKIVESIDHQDEYVLLENNLIKKINEIEKNSDVDILDPIEVEKYCNALYELGLKGEQIVKNRQ